MFTKSVIAVVLALGLLLTAPEVTLPGGDQAVAKQTCCLKRAYCCKIKAACCKAERAAENAVPADNAMAAASQAARPICCMKRAYCCSVQRACCTGGGSVELGEA